MNRLSWYSEWMDHLLWGVRYRTVRPSSPVSPTWGSPNSAVMFSGGRKTGKRGGNHNSLTRILVKPSHIIGGYAQLSFAFNYLGPTGNQRDEVTVIRRRSQEVQY